MQIELEVNTFRELIEEIAVKGKYNSGDTCKNGQVSNYAVLKVEGDYLVAYNADNINIAVIRLRLEEGQLFRSGRTVIDIEKTVKYLKGFTGIVTLEFRDYFMIRPSIGLDIKKNYTVNPLKEKAKAVSRMFEYSSSKNKFLSIKQIKKLID